MKAQRSSPDGAGRIAPLTQRPRITSIPESTRSSLARGSFPVRSVRSDRSTAVIWETLATDSRGNPLSRAVRETLPGASAHFRLPVSGTQTTVARRLRFNASP